MFLSQEIYFDFYLNTICASICISRWGSTLLSQLLKLSIYGCIWLSGYLSILVSPSVFVNIPFRFLYSVVCMYIWRIPKINIFNTILGKYRRSTLHYILTMLHEDNIIIHGIKYYIYNKAIRSYILVYMFAIAGQTAGPIWLTFFREPMSTSRLKSIVSSRFLDPNKLNPLERKKIQALHLLMGIKTSVRSLCCHFSYIYGSLQL